MTVNSRKAGAVRAPPADRPGEDGPHVVAVVVLAGDFGLVAERVPIDGDVALIAEMPLDDVVQLDAGRGPVKLQVRARRTALGRYRPAKHRNDVVTMVSLAGGLGLVAERV